MDHSGGGGGLVAGDDGPGACFLNAGGEVGAEAEELVDSLDEGGDSGVGDPHVGEKFGSVGVFEVDEFFLDAGRDDNCFCSVGIGGVLADLGDEGIAVGVFDGGAEFVFGDIAGEDGALGGEEEEFLEDDLLSIAEFEGEGWIAGVEVGEELVDECDFIDGLLVAALGFLAARLAALIEGSHVGEDQFGVDDLDVAEGIDRAEFVDDVVVFEATDDLHDGVDLADGGEELVAESGAGGGTFDEARDIDELDGGGDEFLGAGDLGKNGEAFIGNGDHADVRIDGAEGVVLRLGLAGPGDGVEEGGLPDVGHSDDSGLEHGAGGSLSAGLGPLKRI